MDLTSQVVVITGGSMGIGEAIGKVFAQSGASIVLASRERERVEAARLRIGYPERTLATACDVRYREDLARLLSLTLHNFGRVDVWVNNAGVGFQDSVALADMAEVRKLFDTNLFSAIEAIQAVAPVMKRQGSGTIINISSVAGRIVSPYGALYAASKFALNAVGDGARMELARYGIHLMTVCPGYVATGFGQNAYKGAERMRLAIARRGISAERVARAVLRGYEKKSREVIVPWAYHIVIKLYQLCPLLVEYGMKRMLEPAGEPVTAPHAARKN